MEKRYRVTLHSVHFIEAENEEQAIEKAQEEFFDYDNNYEFDADVEEE